MRGTTFDVPVTVSNHGRAGQWRPGVRRDMGVCRVDRTEERTLHGAVVDLGAPALEQWCPECAGSGSLHSAAWARWDEEHARLSVQAVDAWREPILQSIVAERLADLSARSPHEPRVLACTRCAGNGVVPTPFGSTVLDFVRRHLG